MSVAVKNRLLREASRLETLDQINERLLPDLARITHASFVFAYRGLANEQGIRAYLPASTPDFVADYFAEYAGECPLRRVKDRTNARVIPTTLLYGHKKLIRTRVYNELWRPWGFDHHVALRFDAPDSGPEVASLGIMINRDHRRGEYAEEELSFLRTLVPSLSRSLRRAAKLEVLKEKVTALEMLVNAGGEPGPKIVLDADGRFIHSISPPGWEAAAAISALRSAKHPVRLASRRLIRETGGETNDEPLELEHRFIADGELWRASISLYEGNGKPLVLLALSSATTDRNLWGLTRSENVVLEQLIAGLNNIEIGRALFISPETVRTHLTRIYKKLGARSRLEAVVKARVRGSA
jgi:DNA-binding CsgD family transcriptional regulator